jgi:hypothetical protein
MPMIPAAQDRSFRKKVEVSSASSYIAARSGRALCKTLEGSPLASRTFLQRDSLQALAEGSKMRWCGRRELNPHGPFEPCGFSCRLRLSPPGCCTRSYPVCGLDYPFTLPREPRGLGAARLVSTPSRLEYLPGLARDCHFKVSPNLSSSTSPVSQASTQVFLKSAAYAIPPRPRAAI